MKTVKQKKMYWSCQQTYCYNDYLSSRKVWKEKSNETTSRSQEDRNLLGRTVGEPFAAKLFLCVWRDDDVSRYINIKPSATWNIQDMKNVKIKETHIVYSAVKKKRVIAYGHMLECDICWQITLM